MKILPCRWCHGQPALARKPSPDARLGIFHTIGRMFGPTITIRCARCRRPSTITSSEFAILPTMTADEIAAPTCDMPWSKPEDVPL